MKKTINSAENTFTSNELRRLSRKDLLLLMLKQAEDIERLKKDCSDMQVAHIREIVEEKRRHAEIMKLQKDSADSQIEMLYSLLQSANTKECHSKSLMSGIKGFFGRVAKRFPYEIKRREGK